MRTAAQGRRVLLARPLAGNAGVAPALRHSLGFAAVYDSRADNGAELRKYGA